MSIFQGTGARGNVLRGTTQIGKVYRGAVTIWENWVFKTGTYLTQIINIDRYDDYHTYSFAGDVKPIKMTMSGSVEQLDFNGDIKWYLDIYYESTGWVNVYYSVYTANAGDSFSFNKTATISDIGEKATQWRYKCSMRNISNDHTIKLTEWYQKGS